MTIQHFLDHNPMTVGKAVIGSPVKMAIEENVELSAIDALQPESFEIQVDESGMIRRVDAVKADHVVAYVHAFPMTIYDRLAYGRKYNHVDTTIGDDGWRAKLIGRDGDQWQAQVVESSTDDARKGQIVKFYAEDLKSPPSYDPNGGFILKLPTQRLREQAAMVGFNLGHIPCPINVQAALRGQETVVGYTADWRQRLEFLAEVGVETCSTFVSARDLYMGILAASPDQKERLGINVSHSFSNGWTWHINWNGNSWSFSEPRS